MGSISLTTMFRSTIFLLVTLAVATFGQEVLVFEDNFDTLDETVWQHMVTGWRGGNHEFQYYRNNRKNSYVQDGVLYIKPSYTADEYGEDFLYNGELNLWEEGCIDEFNIDGGCYLVANDPYIINPIQSARIRSSIGFSFAYGRAEIRAQVPKGDWLWPALWMLPQDWVYGEWPRSGEIDIMETRGNLDFKCYGEPEDNSKVLSTLHWGPSSSQNQFWRTTWNIKRDQDLYGDDFHIYEVNWTPDGIEFYYDKQYVGAVYPPAGGFWELGELHGQNIWENSKMAPFDQKFHFLFNVAVGGNFFPDDGCVNANGPKPWYGQNVPGAMKTFWEARPDWEHTWVGDDIAMKVDYVKVWQTQ